MLPVEQPFKVYTGLDGKPIDGGYVYFGVAGQNPVTAPVTVYWDAAGTQPAAQPLRTTNGYIMRGGTPANVFFSGAYSELVQDKHQVQVFFARDSTDFSIATVVSTFITNLASSIGSSLIGFLQAGVGAVLRTVQSKLREYVSVTDFGAVGDGVTDDTLAIQKADTAASVRGKKLFFPSGTYLTDPLTATTSWFGEIGTIIKYRGISNVDLITATSIDDIEFRDLTIDGNVSADPGAWTSLNYDSFTGATGLTIATSARARVVNCVGQNMRYHSFRLTSCTDSWFESCHSIRNRGKFGDGFISIDCINCGAVDSTAYDFTRIGFVWDTFDAKTGYHLSLTNCEAQYGHDGSILYGGNEYNVGAWFENSAHVTISGLTVRNMPVASGRGLLMTSGEQNNGVIGATATYMANNVRCENTGIGIVTYSLGTFPVTVLVENAQIYGVYQGIYVQPKLAQDNFTLNDCFVDLDFTLSPTNTCAVQVIVDAGIVSKPLVTVNSLVIRHTNESLAQLTGYGTTSSTCDIGSFIGNTNTNGPQLVVRNARNIDGGPIWLGIPMNYAADISLSDLYVRIQSASFLAAGSAVFERVRVHSMVLGDGSASLVELYDCTFEGLCKVGANFVKVEGGVGRFTDSSYLWLFSFATGKEPGIIVTGMYFKKDIAANGYALRFGFGSVSFSAMLTDSQFYNSSGTVTNTPALVYANGTNRIYSSVLKDATLNYTEDIDSGGSLVALPTGVSDVTLH